MSWGEKSDFWLFAHLAVLAAQRIVLLNWIEVFKTSQYFQNSDHSCLNSYSTGGAWWKWDKDTLTTNANSTCKYTTDWCMKVWGNKIAFQSTLKMHILVFITSKKLVRNRERSKTDLLPYCSIWETNSLAQSEHSERAVVHVQAVLQKPYGLFSLGTSSENSVEGKKKKKNPLFLGSYYSSFPFYSQ